ncbi:N-formylglutamate amidohydrolase [Altererythrobacter sp.]|uniref:N-formylglutamate amidohydrolase n=1 Tax=Altererythrobacter sp. TaxID=1872480 RepID=UPI003D0C14D8
MTQKWQIRADSAVTSGDSIVTGGWIADSGRPAFSILEPRNQTIPVLVSVPHAGRDYPPSILENMRDPAYACLKLEDRYVDRLAEEVVRLTGAAMIVSHAPRAMLDLNRARDDVDWGMFSGTHGQEGRHSQSNRRARSGLGLVPRRLPGSGEIWRKHLSREDLDARIEGIHRPYHLAASRRLERIRDEWGAALLLDIHSMPPLKRSYGQERVPRLVIGDRFGASCHGSLASRALDYLDVQGWSAAHNRPYSGGFMLDHHSAPGRGLHAMQLEICRSTYLDGNLNEPGAGLEPMAKLVSGLLRDLGAETARLGQGGQLAQAAE